MGAIGVWWRRELRRLSYAAIGGPIIGLGNFAFLHHRYPHDGSWASIAAATAGGIVGMYAVDFGIPWLRAKLRQ